MANTTIYYIAPADGVTIFYDWPTENDKFGTCSQNCHCVSGCNNTGNSYCTCNNGCDGYYYVNCPTDVECPEYCSSNCPEYGSSGTSWTATAVGDHATYDERTGAYTSLFNGTEVTVTEISGDNRHCTWSVWADYRWPIVEEQGTLVSVSAWITKTWIDPQDKP